MTDRELVIELLNRIAKHHAEKNETNFNSVQDSSTSFIEIGNPCSGSENIDFFFDDDKIFGIAC